jgi:PhnB protein
MEFEGSCLGGELSITRLGETPMKADVPAELRLEDKVVYGTTVGVYLTDARYQELRTVFDKLAVGANPDLLDNLRDRPFGVYGTWSTSTGSRGSSRVTGSAMRLETKGS